MGCRNCGSQSLKELGFVGEIAPFFLKRVLQMEVRTSQARHPLRLLARRVLSFPQRLFTRVYGSNAYVEMQICLDCSFVQTKQPFHDDAISRLYSDYRSGSYNEERIHYEPTYAGVAEKTGIAQSEIAARVEGLTYFLKSKIKPGDDFTMLDYGGADGRFLPSLEGRKYVFEVSNIEPIEGVTRIRNETDLGRYSYIQVAHLLEHVPEPLSLIKRVASFVEPGGYIYIEVPQEASDQELAVLRDGSFRRGLTVHEHINLFCPASVNALTSAAGLTSIAVQRERIDLGWSVATVVRALSTTRAA